jgi:hypothetical protein
VTTRVVSDGAPFVRRMPNARAGGHRLSNDNPRDLAGRTGHRDLGPPVAVVVIPPDTGFPTPLESRYRWGRQRPHRPPHGAAGRARSSSCRSPPPASTSWRAPAERRHGHGALVDHHHRRRPSGRRGPRTSRRTPFPTHEHVRQDGAGEPHRDDVHELADQHGCCRGATTSAPRAPTFTSVPDVFRLTVARPIVADGVPAACCSDRRSPFSS